jgi:hypothetical protein
MPNENPTQDNFLDCFPFACRTIGSAMIAHLLNNKKTEIIRLQTDLTGLFVYSRCMRGIFTILFLSLISTF